MSRLILVDDEKAIRDSASQALMLAGYEVDTFAGAGEALPAISPEFEGVVITDLRMPGMDG
ncbi:MAG: response regulator, partial [Thiothrix sp.]|nr:response regulator [Thiothrix sp.]